MVLSAVLRHSARDPPKATRRRRAAVVDRAARLPALARYVAGTLGEIPAALSAVPDRLLPGGDRARLSRLTAPGGRLRDRGAHPHGLLFCIPSHHPAAARAVRDDKTTAELDLGIRAGQTVAVGREGLGGRTMNARQNA